MSNTEITHRNDEHNFLHHTRLHEPHYHQADGHLGKYVLHLPNNNQLAIKVVR